MLSSTLKLRAAEEDHRWATKVVLRILGFIFAIISLGLFSACVKYTNENFTNTAGPGQWTDGLAVAPAVIAVLYNPVDLVLLLVVRKGRPMHPAFHVALDLITWALLAPAIIVALTGGLFWYWTGGVANEDGTIDCSLFFNSFTRECSPIAYTIGRMEIAGLVFEFILFCIHLSLWVFAIVDLHRKRMAGALAAHDFDMELKKDPEHGSQRS